jgi:catecholate siderophore receptor
VSRYIRSSKKSLQATTRHLNSGPAKLPVRMPIQAAVRSPLTPAAVGLASMMLVTGAASQDTPPAQSPSTAQQRAAQSTSGQSTSGQSTPAQSDTTALPEIRVRARQRVSRPAPVRAAPAAAAAPPPPPAAIADNAAGDVGYSGTRQTITRLPAPLRDTPQTVNVITPQLIADQRSVSMEESLRYIPGITFSAGEGGQQGDGPIIRGFVARGDLFRDGIRDPGWYTRDLFNSERVEVYKGPSAFAFGRGSTGGAINTVTKLPNGTTFTEGVITGTTGPGYRMEVDSSGAKDNIWGRVAALYQDIDTPTRDNVFVRRWGVAPSLSGQWNQLKATVSYIYQGEESVPDYGFTYLPQPAYSKTTGLLTNLGYFGNGAPTPPTPAPRSNWYGTPGFDITNTETHIGTLKLEYELNKAWKAVNATRYMINDRFSSPTAPRSLGNNNNVVFASGTGGGIQAPFFPPGLMTIGRERRERETDNTFFINQTDILGKFETGIFKHSFVSGVEVSHETRDQTRVDLCDPTDILCRTSLFFPVPGTPVNAVVQHKPNSTVLDTAAWYATDQIKIAEAVELLGSVRFDHFVQDYVDLDQALPVNQFLSRTDNVWSYRLGAVLHPTKYSSLYVAYGNAFNPSGELGTLASPSAAALEPEHTNSYEIGGKIDVLDQKLSLSAAAFKIEKTNLRITDPANATITILDGVARVMGVELGAAGKVTDKWSVFTGYSYLDSRILDTPDLSILNRWLPNTPRNNFTFWNTYDITAQWTIGGGAIYQSLGYANTSNTAFVPEYWKFDAMMQYRFTPNNILQLNVYNITDKLYFAQYFGNNVVPASGRSASLTWRVKFVPDKAEKKI